MISHVLVLCFPLTWRGNDHTIPSLSRGRACRPSKTITFVCDCVGVGCAYQLLLVRPVTAGLLSVHVLGDREFDSVCRSVLYLLDVIMVP